MYSVYNVAHAEVGDTDVVVIFLSGPYNMEVGRRKCT